MNIRTRILLGYGYLVALLILSAAGAAIGFHRLGSRVEAVLEENMRSVRSSTAMLEALERQDSAVLALLLAGERSSGELVASDRLFRQALRDAAANLTERDEDRVVADIERRYLEFTVARDVLLAEHPSPPLAAYERDAYPRFAAVKAHVLELLELNHRAMERADREARAAARRGAALHGLLVTLALLSFVVLSRELGRTVLARLAELEAVAHHLARGDRRRRASEVPSDELGVVARELNRALDALEDLEGRASGRRRHQKQLLLALVQRFPEPTAVLALSGTRIASTLSVEAERCLDGAAGALGDLDPERQPEHRIEAGGRSFLLRALVTPDERPTGWLATEDATSLG